MNLSNKFLNDIRLNILNHINDNKKDIMYDIARSTGTTYSLITIVIKKELIPLGLIKPLKKQGRTNPLSLTKKGKEALEYANKLKEVLEVKNE